MLLDAQGTAMHGVLLEVEDSAGHLREAKTDSKGRFRFQGIHNGHFRFKVTMNDFQSLVGAIILSNKAPRAADIRVVMHLGV